MRIGLSVLAWVSMLVTSGQQISGYVLDQISLEALPGATISLGEGRTGTVSDVNGYFELINVAPGRHNLTVSFVGYERKLIADVWVKPGKVSELRVLLVQSASDLKEIVVTGKVFSGSPGSIQITEEQVNRFAATYYDPARLVTSSPDISVTNDQNNEVSVRGLAPHYNVWRLEGAEIVNPNHLSNAGTFLDQPTATGGGVNMLSAQMLDRSVFFYGAFSSPYGNSLGGIFDMNLKTGNETKRQYTAQASLIGLDIASDGPIQKGKKVTYAANYRYSFTGLLTNFGVDFGGESIGFQDLSLSLSMPIGKRTQLKMFGVGGLSFNNFDHRPLEESETQKDRRDIYFDNATGIVGVATTSALRNSNLQTSLVYSVTDNERIETTYDSLDRAIFSPWLNTNQTESVLSLSLSYSRRLGNVSARLGMMANAYRFEDGRFGGSGIHEQQLLRPYLQLSGTLNPRLSWELGGSLLVGSSNETSFNPRATIGYQLGNRNELQVNFGRYSQQLNPYTYYFMEYRANINKTDVLQHSYRATATHRFTISDFQLASELFYYLFPEVNTLLSNSETAKTRGISINAEKTFSSQFYLRAGGSVFNSTVGDENHTYNSKFNLSTALGKEWDRSRNGKDKRLGVNLRSLYQGGRYYYVDFDDRLVVNWVDQQYRTGSYLRFDLRVVWTRYRDSRTSSIALDLQNVAGTRNEAFNYFDEFQGKQVTQYQLGLIPILTWRMEW